jgi:hypothetical protein
MTEINKQISHKIRHPLQVTMRPLYEAMEKMRNGEIRK